MPLIHKSGEATGECQNPRWFVFHIKPTLAAHFRRINIQSCRYIAGMMVITMKIIFHMVFSHCIEIAFFVCRNEWTPGRQAEILRKWHNNIILPQIEKLTSRAHWKTDTPLTQSPTQTTFDEWKEWFKIYPGIGFITGCSTYVALLSVRLWLTLTGKLVDIIINYVKSMSNKRRWEWSIQK